MQAEITWLDRPDVFRVKRLDAHSDHRFFESEESYQKNRETLKQSLNGTWRFRYSENTKKRPVCFMKSLMTVRDLMRYRFHDTLNLPVMTTFITSIPCIQGKERNIADPPAHAAVPEKGCSVKQSIIRLVLM